MSANAFSQMDYENISDWTLGENKPNSNPIKPNFRRARMNVNLLITKDYRKKDDFAVQKNKPNSNPISERPKMNANVFITKDYENETAQRPKKTNPIKPNFKRALFSTKIGNFFPKKIRSSAEKAGEYRLFGHLLQLFRNSTSNLLRIAEKALNSEKVLHSLSLLAHRYNLCYFIFQGWN